MARRRPAVRFAGQWSAVFLAFQSQSWHTDDETGHAIDGGPDLARPALRIVGALVNPRGPAPERETVTLLNACPDDVDLTGWTLADKAKNHQPLTGSLPAGATVTVAVRPPLALGNAGGAVTLLDAGGLKVDGVAYTGKQAAEGRTVVF